MTHLGRLLAMIAVACIAAAAVAEPYRVAPGDSIALSIFGQEDISGTRKVREDGTITVHLLGEVQVAGKTLQEVSEAVAAAAQRAFETSASVIAEIDAYRDVFVIGDVARPGAYAFSPGLTVLQTLALAGGTLRGAPLDANNGREVVEERRRLLLARARIEETEATIAAIDAELSRLDADEETFLAISVEEMSPEAPGGDNLAQQNALIEARRGVVKRAVDGAERRRRLATEEAEILRQRDELVLRQLEMTEANRRDIDTLVERGLARRDRQLQLSVEADDYRADLLEIATFEARARQTVAEAENTSTIAVGRYRQELRENRIAATRALSAARIEFATSRDFLQAQGEVVSATPDLAPLAPRYEIIRNGQTIAADENARLHPADVLRATLAPETPE